MSQINIRVTTAGGTQSPPLEDHVPMGACSIRGGNAGGIPDRQQRSQYFDPSEYKQEQEQIQAQTKPQRMPDATDAVRGQQINLDHLEPAHDPQPAPVLETAPTASGPFKRMSSDDIRSAMRA
ncbi:hypothetical protein BJV78DRAFT_1200923 [Lactifluus subvellereus]|nr:hypothetical protein BJV78DRAFT_1200923 [Lactifluus subvellereus]